MGLDIDCGVSDAWRSLDATVVLAGGKVRVVSGGGW